MRKNSPLKPPLLKPGDKIGIVAPGGSFNREKFDLGIALIKKWGLVPVYGPHLFKKDLIFAGTVDQRVESLRAMLARDDVKGLWCVRGGYGTYDVAEKLAGLKMKVPKPKVILGQSDIFAFQMICLQNWKWPVLHSPLLDRIGQEKATVKERRVLQKTLFDGDYRLEVTAGLKVLGRGGDVVGAMTGGNLVMATASLKTSWEIETDGKILFLEEIGERAYRIDRFLFQLETAGKFKNVKAVVIGDFTECQEPDGKQIWKDIIRRRFARAKFPVLWGVHAGHGSLRLTLPLGVNVRVKTRGRPKFEVLESYARGEN